jgi:hypothetical protein
MKLLVTVDDSVHTAALRKARELGEGPTLPGTVLHAMLDDDVSSWVRRIWDDAEAAIRRAYHEGLDAAQPYIQKVSDRLSELGSATAKHIEEVRAIVTAKLNAYLQETIDGALSRVRGTVSIGGRAFSIEKVTIDQTVKLSGSLKASLEEICEFVAEGEISLSAEYGSARVSS